MWTAAGDVLAVLGALHQQMPGRWPVVAGLCSAPLKVAIASGVCVADGVVGRLPGVLVLRGVVDGVTVAM
jgi:hypothetical protein